MAFTYNDSALTDAGVTRDAEVEEQIAILDDDTEIETFIELIGATRGGGAAISTEINTAAEYASLLASWHGYRNLKK
jgi:hypothetical protein